MKDPVCGMELGETGGFKSLYKRRTYYFCSANCKAEFDKNPGRYAK